MAEVVDTRRPLWQRRWFQVMLAVLLGLLLASFIVPPIFSLVYELRSVLLPVVIGFILAYIVNPAITAAQVRYHIPRWASTAAIMVLGVLMVTTLLLLAVPPMVAQSTELVIKARQVYPTAVVRLVKTAEDLRLFEYPERLAPTPAETIEPAEMDPADAGPTDVDPAAADAPALDAPPEPDPAVALRAMLDNLVAWLQQLDWSSTAAGVARSLDIGVGVVTGAIGLTTYLFLAAVIIAFCFFYFAWRFDLIIAWFAAFVPVSQRSTTYRIVRQMDRSVAAFVRGRLVQVAVMTVILSIGWYFAGVPYWLLLGVLTGLLNLVPFVPVFGWLIALTLTLIDHAAGAQGVTLWTLLAPSIVYFAAQGVDGWIVEPVVQGHATNLDPLTVLLVVLIGGALAGLLGMLVAIPVAACIKILAREVVLPRLRQLAAEN